MMENKVMDQYLSDARCAPTMESPRPPEPISIKEALDDCCNYLINSVHMSEQIINFLRFEEKDSLKPEPPKDMTNQVYANAEYSIRLNNNLNQIAHILGLDR